MRSWSRWAWVGLAAFSWSACAAEPRSAGGASGAAGFGGSSAVGGGGLGGGGASGLGGLGGASGTTVQIGDECAADTYVADQKRLDIYMIVDESGSMIPWWPQTLEAINMFLSDPGSAGIGVGLQFFGASCDASTYATPRVPIAPLPGNFNALQSAFPLGPFSDTATVPAMTGAIMHAQQHALANPDAKVVVLLVTDGLPSDECGSSVQGVMDVAAMGFASHPSIQTFVVGLGFDLTPLNMFAAAGGTGQATLVQPGASAALLTALNQIRGAALPCDYRLPEGSAGDVQADTINLRHTPPGGDATVVGGVPDEQRCHPQEGGWYYDNPLAPTRLVACASTCQRLNEAGGEVQVVLGCPRRIIVPD